jgi:hypothetical protein
LKAIAALDGQIVADMGTQHNKLVEANRLKYADFVVQLLKLAFGPEAILASPKPAIRCICSCLAKSSTATMCRFTRTILI